MQLFARELTALPAIRFAFALAAVLDGAFRAPERLFNRQASAALHNFTPFTFAA